MAAVLGDTELLPVPRSLWAEGRGSEWGEAVPEVGMLPIWGLSWMVLSWSLQTGVLGTWVQRRHGVLHSKGPGGSGKTGRLASPVFVV